MSRKPILLASKSKTRLRLLKNAGVKMRAVSSGVDEGAVKRRARATGKPVRATALQLAGAKAEEVARKFPRVLVIAADQMLECRGRWLDKAKDARDAERQLAFLSGKTHYLVTATVLRQGKKILWRDVTVAKLTMRPLSKSFIRDYVRRLGRRALVGVGCYQIEGLGAQLFTRVTGDIFTIQGLNLLPLLAALRRHA